MTTNMIRADIDVRSFYRWAGSRGMISRNAFDPGFAMHCLLTESFGRDLAPKPFRVIIPRDRNRNRDPGTFYAYSTSPAEELRDTAQTFSCPLQSKILPPSSIDGKTMPDTWRTGQRLGFEALIRPVVRCGRGSDRPGKERDAFQAEAGRYPKGEMPRSREEVYRGLAIRQACPARRMSGGSAAAILSEGARRPQAPQAHPGRAGRRDARNPRGDRFCNVRRPRSRWRGTPSRLRLRNALVASRVYVGAVTSAFNPQFTYLNIRISQPGDEPTCCEEDWDLRPRGFPMPTGKGFSG